jgi:hypothetical protein
MKQVFISFFLIVLMTMVGAKAYAFDIAVKNADGVKICYNYINDAKDLEVASGGNYQGAITIPEEVTFMNETRKVTAIGTKAFINCHRLTSVTIPNSVVTIGEYAFYGCSSLTSVTIPNSVTAIRNATFKECISLTSITIPNSVTTIGESAFALCFNLSSITILNGVKTIGDKAFSGCLSLTSITFLDGVETIGNSAFNDCPGLTSVTIPNSVTNIGNYAFYCDALSVVISLIDNPFRISNETFSPNTIKNATLYVPVGTIDKYNSTDGWKDFLYIEEGTGGGGTSTPKKCEKPAISYSNGKLKFTSGTEGASCQYNITDTDIKAGSGNDVQLTVTYCISVYATKAGYDNSETVTATLCWIDVNPKTEGIESAIANVRANSVLMQSNGGMLNITGLNDGTDIVVYSVSGQMVGSSKAMGNQASVFTNMKKGEIAIVKIGDKSVKVVMQ